jgi:small subunit ribosomal protein S17
MMAAKRQQKVGVVSSTKMQKTVVVTVVRQIMHRLYHRVVRRSAKFLAHDEAGNCRLGDTVRIEETRPLSARKRWRVVETISRGKHGAQKPEVAA